MIRSWMLYSAVLLMKDQAHNYCLAVAWTKAYPIRHDYATHILTIRLRELHCRYMPNSFYQNIIGGSLQVISGQISSKCLFFSY